jgi:hypothetical protein
MSAAPLLDELTSMGIKVRVSEDGKLRLKPKARITPDLIERVRADREQLAWLVRDRTKSDRIAKLDAERRETDRLGGRGYDFDPAAPSHAEYLNRRDPLSDPAHPAYGIIATCRRYRVALRLDPDDGALVLGKDAARADEPTQPWPSLVREVEAHFEALARLVAVGWHLRADFSDDMQ